MAVKQQELDSPSSCWNKAEVDEPLFVLRAHDPLAPWVVRFWVFLSWMTWTHYGNKRDSARRIAKQMKAWRQFQKLTRGGYE